MTDETRDIESDEANVDAGGKAHTSSSEPHPAGDGERSDREVGGPVVDEDAESPGLLERVERVEAQLLEEALGLDVQLGHLAGEDQDPHDDEDRRPLTAVMTT